jgi:hypothetical protein
MQVDALGNETSNLMLPLSLGQTHSAELIEHDRSHVQSDSSITRL